MKWSISMQFVMSKLDFIATQTYMLHVASPIMHILDMKNTKGCCIEGDIYMILLTEPWVFIGIL